MKGLKLFVTLAMMSAMLVTGCSKKDGAGIGAGAKADMKNFSATISMQTPGGAFDGKLFVAGGEKMRTEMPQSVTITRIDKGVVWILMPGQKMYMEQPIEPENVLSFDKKVPGETSREVISEEVVDGKKTDKYKITYVVNDKETSVIQWVDKENGMPIKMGSADGTWGYSFKNFEPGTQVAELFELPDGYVKMEMPKMPEGMQ